MRLDFWKFILLVTTNDQQLWETRVICNDFIWFLQMTYIFFLSWETRYFLINFYQHFKKFNLRFKPSDSINLNRRCGWWCLCHSKVLVKKSLRGDPRRDRTDKCVFGHNCLMNQCLRITFLLIIICSVELSWVGFVERLRLYPTNFNFWLRRNYFKLQCFVQEGRPG